MNYAKNIYHISVIKRLASIEDLDGVIKICGEVVK